MALTLVLPCVLDKISPNASVYSYYFFFEKPFMMMPFSLNKAYYVLCELYTSKHFHSYQLNITACFRYVFLSLSLFIFIL